MSSHLKTLAEASLDVETAETAVNDSAWQTATDALDRAAAGLDELRAAWPELGGPERAIVGSSAAGLKRRMEDARRRVPKLTALSLGSAIEDPEQEEAPPLA
jgi:hypothetical protein